MRGIGVLGAWLLLSGCGAKVVFDGGGGQSGGEGGTGGSTSTSIGASDVVVTIEVVDLTASCMPAVGPDPMSGTVTVRYFNGGSADGSLQLTDAQVLFANPMEGWVFPISLSPTDIGVLTAGSVDTIGHKKVETPGDASFVCSLCGQDGQVSLTFIGNDGQTIQASESFQLACAL